MSLIHDPLLRILQQRKPTGLSSATAETDANVNATKINTYKIRIAAPPPSFSGRGLYGCDFPLKLTAIRAEMSRSNERHRSLGRHSFTMDRDMHRRAVVPILNQSATEFALDYPPMPNIADQARMSARLRVHRHCSGAGMCEHDDLDEFARRASELTRRQFGAMALGAGFVAALPRLANAAETQGTDVEIKTPDGLADAFFVHPAKGKYTGVLIWPDIFGLRPAFKEMATPLV